jgi:hypothetical protein
MPDGRITLRCSSASKVDARAQTSGSAAAEPFATAQVPLYRRRCTGEESRMLFWPIVIALGPGFVALYYDHEPRSFRDQSVCEQTLPELAQRAKQTKEFMTALSQAAGNKLPNVRLKLACINKTPQEFQQDLDARSGDKTST